MKNWQKTYTVFNSFTGEDKFWMTIKEADFILNEKSRMFGLSKEWELEKLIKNFIEQQRQEIKEKIAKRWKYVYGNSRDYELQDILKIIQET